ESIAKYLQDSETAEYAVVIVSSLNGTAVESYAFTLAEGVLGDKEKNNGLLLLVAVEDRKYRIEVGRGIEPILNDAKVGRIGRQYLVENFRAENYSKGVVEASRAIASTLTGEENSTYYINDAPTTDAGTGFPYYYVYYIWGFFILLSIISTIFRSKKNKTKENRFFDAALMAGLLFGGRGGRGGGFGGLGGGGFGGFSGGSFGGGGSGGGW
ncbi:TPM domain-containing protein, partial [Candidatus Woesearchaeota archaeon]|nr:TPM domain-containing protein [Candidatus Woesearchaeota archaeon]